MSLLANPRNRARLVVFGLGALILIGIWRFLPGLIGGAILYVIFDRIYRWLSARTKPRFAAWAIVIAAILLIMLPGIALLTLLVGRAPAIVEQAISGETFTRLSAVQVGEIQLGSVLESIGAGIREALPAQALRLLGGLLQTTLNLVIALFVLYYLLLGGRLIWERVREFLPLSAVNAESLRVRFRSVTEAMLIGIVLTAIVQGAIVGIGFRIVGLSEPVFWGGVTAIVSILPVFGSGLVWFPASIVLLADGNITGTVILLILGAGLASNVDNLIRIIVYDKVSDVHPLITILGAFAGIAIFGLWGVLVGPLFLSYFFELARTYRTEFGPETPDAARALDDG